MSGVRDRMHAIAIGMALAMALVALAGTAWARPQGTATSAALKPNVKVVIKSFSVSNGDFASGSADCPSGTRIFGGGYISGGRFAQIIAAAPFAKTNDYNVSAWMPPVNVNVPVLKETALIAVSAWCAPPGQPIVLPKP